MRFIHAQDHDAGAAEMAGRIAQALNEGRRVLWLVCGGSNVATTAQAMLLIRSQVSSGGLAGLTLAQTDERYGPVGHPDSNWKQLQDTGFDFKGITSLPMLTGRSLEQTVSAYESVIGPALAAHYHSGTTSGPQPLIVALFGIGPDGHIAGMLPHSSPISSDKLVGGYDAGKFIRISLTPPALKKIDVAYAFAFGGSKKEAVQRLRDEDLPLDQQPAQILKMLPEAFLYSDQI